MYYNNNNNIIVKVIVVGNNNKNNNEILIINNKNYSSVSLRFTTSHLGLTVAETSTAADNRLAKPLVTYVAFGGQLPYSTERQPLLKNKIFKINIHIYTYHTDIYMHYFFKKKNRFIMYIICYNNIIYYMI